LHGLTDQFQTDLQIRTIGFLTTAELGVRFRPLETKYLCLALEIDVHGVAAVALGADGAAAVAGGPTGAFLVSVGPSWFQWTASFTARVTFFGEGDFIPGTEASIGVDFPLSRGLNTFIEGSLMSLFIAGDDDVHVPIVSHGLAF
jgi:hypothetical protein